MPPPYRHKKFEAGMLVYLALIVVIVLGSLAWSWVQYKECREMGLSRLYCWQHIL